ncbi:relaxase/mobilization nuclease domain-containing protein (plasmid) [Priestia filamentosa]|nr:relaxase/mobilization nuclease domain-containing protein [Priestia filamentosa]
MATIQRSTTKVANKLISYAEKRAQVREGVNCPTEYAKAQMKATRELWGKNDGIQAHHVIQSFSPGEVTPEMANQIGQDLVKEIARGYEAVVYTHTDKDHIHNHIVINSVNYEDGKKYHASNESLYQIREANDRLCKEYGLSIVQEKHAPIRYTLAEKSLLEKGQISWKDEIRQVIDYERQYSKTYEDFKRNLTEQYGIEVKERGKNITFTHPDNDKKVRGATLGSSYEKETLKHEFTREIEQTRGERSPDRGKTKHELRGNDRSLEGDGGLSLNFSQREYEQGNDDDAGARKNQTDEPTGTRGDSIDLEAIDRHLAERNRATQEIYQQQFGDSSRGDRENGRSVRGEQENRSGEIGQHEREYEKRGRIPTQRNQAKSRRTRRQQQEYDIER